jgi:hypothetical protein
MALSMDEQRVLAEIERRLAADDPGLATCLTSFRRPGPVTVLRSPRARIIGSLFTVLLVTMVSLMVYAMIPFRTHSGRTPTAPASSAHATVVLHSPGQPAAPSAGANADPASAQGTGSQAAVQVAPAAIAPAAVRP